MRGWTKARNRRWGQALRQGAVWSLAHLGGLALGGLSLSGCDLLVTDEEGKEQCLDDFLRDKGSSRTQLEEQAARRGIEASKVLKEIYDTTFGVVDTLVDCTASEALGGLATATGGEFFRVPDPDEGMDKVSDETGQISGDSVDLVFLVDTTGSMSSSIDTVRRRLASVLETLKDKEVRVAMAFYRDNNVDEPWYFRNRSGLVAASTDEVPDFLQSAEASGGGDFAESLYDGLFDTLSELEWQGEERVLVAITDAPPLTGDLTDHTQAEVVAAAAAAKVRLLTIQVSLF